MKKFRQYITLSMILACVSTSLQSCLFEEKDYFDQPAAIRLTEDVNHYQKILQDAPNGWVLEYNIGEDNPMGVIPVLCRFEAGKVDMSTTYPSSGTKPGDVYSSLYSIKSEQSTLLSFDTYNPLLHVFGTPGIANPRKPNSTLEGDYEFILRSGTAEQVVLEGRKYHNRMVLNRLDKDVDWKVYIRDTRQVEDEAFLSTYKLMNKDQELARLKRKNFIFDYTSSEADGSTDNIPFMYTPTGLKLYNPVLVNGIKAENFKWNKETLSFDCTDKGAEQVTLTGYYPDGFTPYADFLGTYTLTVHLPTIADGNVDWSKTQTMTVKIEQKEVNRSYVMTGANLTMPLPLVYNRGTGTLSIESVKVGPYSKYYMAICMAAKTGYYGLGAGSLTAKIAVSEPMTISFVGSQTDISGFALVAYEDEGYAKRLGWWDWYGEPVLVKQQ